MSRLTIALLGAFQVTLDCEPITSFATDKARALLAYLAVEADRPHRRDVLAGLLWPDQPQRKARQNLRQALSHLRHTIHNQDEEEPFLLIGRKTIQFNPGSDHWLDVAAFAALVEDCREHRHRSLKTCLPCIRRMEQMVELYRGEFLEQFFLSDSSGFEEWATLKREWLHRKAVEALLHLANHHERRGEYWRARQYARRQAALEPWREEAHRQLMRLLALDGQRSAALAQYETCRRALAEELGVQPTAETTELYEQIRESATADLQTCRLADLPLSPTPFVGREEELANLAELLANPDCRLVTIFGPGGIGKSRLALQVATEQIGAFAHGVYFVHLASISSVESIVPAITDVLQISLKSNRDPREQLLNYLRTKEMLLVLDNIEHLLEGSTLLAEMLHRAPGLVLLVTSRERLNLHEEWVYEIEGLEYPDDKVARSDKTYSAAALFYQHARRANRDFSPSEAEASHVTRICQLVEGMPLGIELAASWVTVYPCEQIVQGIENGLDILTTRLRNVPERQRSIRATFEHSWRLLAQAERDALARLSIFQGGFRQEAAAQVAGVSPATLLALLDKSLIRRVSPERYDIHPLLKQYAAEKLQDDPQKHRETQVEHVRYFAAFLAQQEQRLKSADQGQALTEIGSEIDNVRLAWHSAVTHGHSLEIEQSLESLYRFYDIRCRFQEGIDLLAQAQDWQSGDEQERRIFGKIMARQGVLSRRLGHYQQATALTEQSLDIFEQLGAQAEQAFCLINLADVLCHQGKYIQAKERAQKSLALSRQANDRWGVARSLFLLGVAQYRTGDVDQAEELLEESLAISRESGNPRLIMPPLNTLADIVCHRGDYDQAIAMFGECLALSRELGDQFNAAIHLNNLGTVLHVLEKHREASTFFQESLEICREIGDQVGEAIALSNLGQVVHELGMYPEAMAYYREGLTIGRSIQDQWTIMACLNNLGETACAIEDYQAARAYLAEAMRVATETQSLTVLAEILVNVAILFAKQGQADQAAMLLKLASRHPASEQAVQKKAKRLMDEMGLTPPEQLPASLDAAAAAALASLDV